MFFQTHHFVPKGVEKLPTFLRNPFIIISCKNRPLGLLNILN